MAELLKRPASSLEDNFHESTIQGSVSAIWVLSVISVILRFVARRMSNAGIWYDDWIILPALLCGFGLWFVSTIWMVKHGFGTPAIFLSVPELREVVKGGYIGELLWTVALALVKLSILSLYLRLFGQCGTPRRIIQGLMAIVACWGISILFLSIFQCTPISRVWNPEHGSCITNALTLQLASAIPHIITDIMILSTPIPFVWTLQLRLTQKAILCGIFSLGGFVTIVSGIRLHYLRTPISMDDFTMNIRNIAIWTNVEVNTAIICACLPCLRPIVSLLSDKFEAFRKCTNSARQGKELLVDMLPRREQAPSTPAQPSGRSAEFEAAGAHQDRTPREVEAAERRMPEMAAVRGGPLELGGREVAIPELNGQSRSYSVAELDAAYPRYL